MASSEAATLVNIALDLQITICTFLHPPDILALRQTCKAFQLVTRQRVVWMEALHRVCIDNTLFLPSFPILDMTVEELEHAAMGPRRWIELCAAFEKHHPNDSGATPCPSATRIIEHPLAAHMDSDSNLFIVPGGRYLVSLSDRGIFVWDLGYTSSADYRLIASVEREGQPYSCMVQATPDGTGFIILSSYEDENDCVYEIYPESETPQLVQIARLNFSSVIYDSHLLPDKVIRCALFQDRTVFRVCDFRVNHSIGFSAVSGAEVYYNGAEIIATKTAIIALCNKEILVWAIPPLSPQVPLFLGHNATFIPPLLRIAYPDVVLRHTGYVRRKRLSHWYYGSSQPLYFDILLHSKLHRFKIIIKPDLNDTSLHVINTSDVAHLHIFDDSDILFQPYNICEDTLVTCWRGTNKFGVYTSSCSADVVSHGGPATKMLLPGTGYPYPLCPASGRFVYPDGDGSRLIVVDFF